MVLWLSRIRPSLPVLATLLLLPLLPGHALQNITLSSSLIPLQPPSNASQVLDKALASFSIEIAYMDAFAGNVTEGNGTSDGGGLQENVLTRELMQRLVERTGVGPDIRPGGITVDSSIYDANSSALVLDESTVIFRTTYGPGFYKYLSVFPNTTKFVLSVNLGNDTISIARNQLAAGIENIGWDRLRALELGNEPDHYPSGSRPSGWNSADYTAQFLGWTSVLTRNLSLPKGIWQAGSFADDPTSSALMTTVDIVQEGVATMGVIEVFSQHMYQYSTCDPTRNAIATLPNLVNHSSITAYVDLWKPQIAAARDLGKDFVVGEYSSVSCSGKENVTNAFGQALWIADTVLYSASINITRMYLHQGATLVLQSSTQENAPGFSWYDLWYPIDTERYGAARASPSYVSYLLITEAIGPSPFTSRITLVDIPTAPQVAVYAVWEGKNSSIAARDDGSSAETGEEALSRLVILNLGHRNVSSTDEEKDDIAVSVDLSPFVTSGSANVTVKRMTATGMDSTDSDTATWAGQGYAQGVASGEEVIEGLNGGNTVRVGGTEGVVVFLR
ncbi:uncharacterized protein STEHIDRAFT_48573 [Stereum hirsutum FP-91666 SS1]|uniref:uncharacterized protein n=1 Tax=Stereum hirsutum (strain FP-91666) TaxID=721885 RepID=UPI000441025E|nr:uncharacterized protein STEHIDRAFT_48573 [Stereum hirsutum FP-91666 SS1]EIM91232.1 hypothetical protein STEHIDRAFT_48573 [Stereum hirsutum FP-91666 SS1]